MKKKMINRQGVTLIELVVSIVTALIVLFGIGVFIVDMQRGYGRMYGRVHGDIVRDAYVARRAFDGVVRKAARYYVIDMGRQRLTVEYWRDNEQELPDCTAMFQFIDGKLLLKCNFSGESRTETLARNVTDCQFYMTGPSAQMILTLDDPDDNRGPVRVVSSAVQHIHGI